MITSLTQHIFFFTLFAGALALMYFIAEPFLVPILIAIVIAVIFRGAHKWLLEKLGGRANIAALLSVFLVAVCIILPLIFIGLLVFNEARGLYVSLATEAPQGIWSKWLDVLNARVSEIIPGFNVDVQAYARTIVGWFVSNTSAIFTSFIKIVVDIFILILALFFFFRDGGKLKEYIIKLSPLDRVDDEDIIGRLDTTVHSVMRGTLIVAVSQGTLAAIGFTIFGIGNGAIWGVVAAIAALVPGIGVGLVNLPAIIYLFATGDTAAGIGFLLWSVLVTGTIDNILNPLIMEQRMKVHPFLILLAVLGGLAYFGPIGFIAGPIALAFAIEMLRLYPRFVASNISDQQTKSQ